MGDNGFNSLTLHLPQWRSSWKELEPLSFHAFSAQYSSELWALYHSCIWPLHGRNSSVVLHRSRRCYAFITSAPAVNLWEQTAVYCPGGDGVRISNRLIPPRDNTTNITVIHQKKCWTSRVFTPLCIFHQTFQPQKVMPYMRRRCARIWMNGINGNPCCHLLLKDRILKHVTEWLIMPMCFLEVILIWAVRGKLLFLLSDQTDTLLTRRLTFKPTENKCKLLPEKTISTELRIPLTSQVTGRRGTSHLWIQV